MFRKRDLVYFGLEVRKYLLTLIGLKRDLGLAMGLSAADRAALAELSANSKSQMQQDLFVLAELRFKRDGYFVDFGATDGVINSNSYLLEKQFGWRGVCAEPSRFWHGKLRANRNCKIETDCVWTESGTTIEFYETELPELSTLTSFRNSDMHAGIRKPNAIYNVNSISLNDLLEKYNAPKLIDYLSIDTEGSELLILTNFDFLSRRIKIITCEHNYSENRERIFNLLRSKGYVRKYKEFSQFDDWYVLED